jgi:hypothetical protein
MTHRRFPMLFKVSYRILILSDLIFNLFNYSNITSPKEIVANKAITFDLLFISTYD